MIDDALVDEDIFINDEDFPTMPCSKHPAVEARSDVVAAAMRMVELCDSNLPGRALEDAIRQQLQIIVCAIEVIGHDR